MKTELIFIYDEYILFLRVDARFCGGDNDKASVLFIQSFSFVTSSGNEHLDFLCAGGGGII